jgi:hypothetical protein
MDITQFELLYNPQSPAPGLSDIILTQGYFLEITNLENEEYQFALNLIAPEPSSGNPLRSLSGNTQVFVTNAVNGDTGGVLTGGSGTYRPSSGNIRIAPRSTVLVTIIPSVFASVFDPTAIANPEFKVNGYARLRLPPVFTVIGGGSTGPFIQFGPQASEPVKVMVTGQKRTVYQDQTGNIIDQTQSTYPVCAGQSCIEIPPEPAFIPIGPVNFAQRSAQLEDFMTATPAEDLGANLAAMLGAVDPDKADLEAFNKSLNDAKIPFRLDSAKARPSRARKKKA